MRVVTLKHQTHILAGSPYDSQQSPVQTYDAPEDLKERVIAGVDSYFKGTLTPEGEFDFNNIIADAYKGRTPEELMSDMLRYTEEVDVVGFSGMKYSE